MDIGAKFSLGASLEGEELQDRWDLVIGDKILLVRICRCSELFRNEE